jgi:hypothetical protein
MKEVSWPLSIRVGHLYWKFSFSNSTEKMERNCFWRTQPLKLNADIDSWI